MWWRCLILWSQVTHFRISKLVIVKIEEILNSKITIPDLCEHVIHEEFVHPTV